MKLHSGNRLDKWWESAVIYQVYPRSFFDTNEDGIGDIRGIIQKLHHIKDLGVTAVWVSPFFASPMADFGYDVSDYYSADPIFGTNNDVLDLINTAHSLGLKIIFDLVFNHTSSDHPWFVESRSSIQNPKRDWYIWHTSVPNNWESIFGGSSWSQCKITGEYYYHSFLPEQPDLNLRNYEVIDELKKIMRHYLQLGVDGFRMDAVNTFYEDEELRDNPIKKFCDDSLCHITKLRKYDFDNHQNFDLIEELKEVMNEFDNRLLLGEVSTIGTDDQAWKKYLGDNDSRLDLAMNFDLLYGELSYERFFQTIKKWEMLPPQKLPTYALSSHDQIRYPSRLGVDDLVAEDRIKMVSSVLLTLRGAVFVYYGDELGMGEYSGLSRDQIRDPLAIRMNYTVPTRDGCRTPMLWTKDDNSGFTKSPSPWLPIHHNYQELCVQNQLSTSDSILNHYQKLIKIRNTIPALQYGTLTLQESENNILIYTREYESVAIECVFNFSDSEYPLSIESKTPHLSNKYVENILQPNGFCIYEKPIT